MSFHLNNRNPLENCLLLTAYCLLWLFQLLYTCAILLKENKHLKYVNNFLSYNGYSCGCKMYILIAWGKCVLQHKISRLVCFENTFVKNNSSFYEQLIAPIEGRMIRSIWRIVRNPQEAEDTLQEALAVIWKRQKRIRNHPNPQALILKICLDSAYDSLRKRKCDRLHEGSEILQQLPDLSATDGPEVLEKKNAEAEILNAISRLPRKEALAVFMRIVQGLPYDAIAEVLKCSEVTVRIHVSRGRAKLSRWLIHLLPSPSKEVVK